MSTRKKFAFALLYVALGLLFAFDNIIRGAVVSIFFSMGAWVLIGIFYPNDEKK